MCISIKLNRLSQLAAQALLAGRSLNYELGQRFELESLGINYKDPTEPVYQVEAWHNKYGHTGVRIIPNASQPTTSVLVRFDNQGKLTDFSVEYWYEHSLDAMLGPYWHHAGGGAGGDRIFEGLDDMTLKGAYEVLTDILANDELMAEVSYTIRKMYLGRVLRIVAHLLTEEGKALREMASGVRRMREHKCGYALVYGKLNTL